MFAARAVVSYFCMSIPGGLNPPPPHFLIFFPLSLFTSQFSSCLNILLTYNKHTINIQLTYNKHTINILFQNHRRTIVLPYSSYVRLNLLPFYKTSEIFLQRYNIFSTNPRFPVFFITFCYILVNKILFHEILCFSTHFFLRI